MAKSKTVVEVDYKVKGVDNVESSFEKVGDSANSASKSVDKVNTSTTAFGDQLPGIAGKAQGMFKSLKTGFATAKTGFTSLKVGIASTGIGILLIAFGSLMAYFTKTERGAEKLRVITAVLGGVMDGIMDIAIGLGEAIFDAFNNPMESLEKLGNFIKENLMNRVTAIGKAFSSLKQILSGDISGGLKGLANAALQAQTGVEDVIGKMENLATQSAEAAKKIMAIAEAAGVLQNAMNELENAERDYAVTSAKNNSEMERNIALSKDKTLTDKERIDALKEAGRIEKETVAQEIKFAQERLRIISEQNALAESGEKDIQAEKDAEIALINLQTESFKKLGSIKSQESALEESITNERLANIKAIKDAEEKARVEKKALEEKAIEDQKELEAKALEEKRLEDEKRVRIEQGRIDLELSLQEDGVDKEIALIKRSAEKRREKLEEEGILTQELRLKLEEDTNNKILEAQKKADDLAKQQKDAVDKKKIDDDKAVADLRMEVEREVTDSIKNFSGSLVNALGQDSKTGLAIQKTTALAEIAVNTAKAISSLTANSQANPANSVTFGGAGIAQFAAGILQIGANMASAYALLKQPAPQIDGGGGSASAPAPQTNETRAVDNTFNGTSAGSQSFQPTLIKAYVTESDISQSQTNANQIQNLSQLG